MCVIAFCANAVRGRFGLGGGDDDSQDGYILSAVAGLLALLLGFTFTMAVDRFDARRVLVLDEANAIGTTYLRTQLIVEPHRTRLSNLLSAYVDNRLVLGKATTVEAGREPLAKNDALIVDLWTATSAAWDSIKGYDFSSAYLDSMNAVIDLDASRKTARNAHVPIAIFGVLFVYVIVTAGVLGYVIQGRRSRMTAAFLMALFTMSLMLVVDIDRPIGGRVVETQVPMERLQAFIHGTPRATFDRWKPLETPPAKR
jgi:hypothetical protein